MKRLLILLVLCSATLRVGMADEVKRTPAKLTLTLAWVADGGEPKQYDFIINGVVAYRTVDGLKKYLKSLPRGSTLTWAPGCDRIGNEPLLGSEAEMKSFKEFCVSCGINFVLVPSG